MTGDIKEVLQRIYDCQRCTFWRDIKRENLDYRPDIPVVPVNSDGPPKILVFGINPGWKDSAEYQDYRDLYRIADASAYRTAVQDFSKKAGWLPGQYDRGAAEIINEFNSHLGLLPAAVTPSSVWTEAVWANLSFCNSQTPYQRVFSGKTLTCNVLNEEIHNCLDAGFARDLYGFLKPRLVLFLAKQVTNVLHPTIILRKLLDKSVDSFNPNIKTISCLAFSHGNGIPVNTDVTLIEADNCLFVFMPHPGYRMTEINRRAAIAQICGNQTLFNSPGKA